MYVRKVKAQVSDAIRKRYNSAHWGIDGAHTYEVDDPALPDELVEMGKLVEFEVDLEGTESVLGFRRESILAFSTDKAERLYPLLGPKDLAACKAELWQAGGQDYPLEELARHAGGRQAKLGGYPQVRVQPLGEILTVTYKTEKKGDGPSVYVHELGEESGIRPWLGVDRHGRLWVAGGDYTVPDEGIKN